MLTKFRNLYPQGSILSELIDIDRGIYIVRVSIQIDGITLATGLAGADVVEKAEDSARNRALQALVLEDGHLSLNLATKAPNKVTTAFPTVSSEITTVTETNHRDDAAFSKKSTAQESLHLPLDEPLKTSTTEVPQAKIATTTVEPQTVPPQITQPPVQAPLLSEPSAEKIPQPEPEVIASTSQPATTTAIPEYTEEILETSLELTSDRESLTATEEDYASQETSVTETPAEFDFNQIRHKIDLEMKRLSWTKEQGRDYLLSTYGKRSRLHLTDDELLEFWHYLETLPN